MSRIEYTKDNKVANRTGESSPLPAGCACTHQGSDLGVVKFNPACPIHGTRISDLTEPQQQWMEHDSSTHPHRWGAKEHCPICPGTGQVPASSQTSSSQKAYQSSTDAPPGKDESSFEAELGRILQKFYSQRRAADVGHETMTDWQELEDKAHQEAITALTAHHADLDRRAREVLEAVKGEPHQHDNQESVMGECFTCTAVQRAIAQLDQPEGGQ